MVPLHYGLVRGKVMLSKGMGMFGPMKGRKCEI